MGEHRRGRLQSIGGIAGAVAAIAGGLGAAAGLYTLPNIDHFRTGGHAAYTAVEQRAIAASTLKSGPFGGTILRVSVSRGVRNGVGFEVAGDDTGVHPSHQGSQDVGVLLEAEVHDCFEHGCEPRRQWRGMAPLESFEFDLAMNTASFSAEVGGCNWVVTWSGEGEIVPFENHGIGNGSDQDGDDWHAQAFVGAGAFGEVSRTARAHIELTPGEEDPSCPAYVRDGAPAYLTQAASLGEVALDARVN